MTNILSNLKLQTRLYILLASMLVGLLVLGSYSVLSSRGQMLDEKQLATRSVVDTAVGVLNHYYDLQQKGVLTEEAAQEQAKETLRSLRYKGSEYFWINDMSPKMVMHPMKPELEGKDLSETKDPNGKALFVEMVNAVKKDGQGRVDYQWPKPGKDKPVPKLSYVEGFKPWGWIVGSGIYVDDVEAAFWDHAATNITFIAILAVLLGFLGIAINRSVLLQIGGEPKMAATQVDHFAHGDLTQVITSDSKLAGNLLGALATMQAKLLDIIREINKGTELLAKESGELAVASTEISTAASNQAESSAATAASIEELTVSINEVSEIAKMTEDNSHQTAQLADKGAEMVGNAAREIEDIARSVQESGERINALVGRSQEIGSITMVIKDIADQTNLLALNAAIEAARAGEQGRGFAVVADEVRKLAERTTQATEQIRKMVGEIQLETNEAVQAMENAAPKVKQGQELARQATELLGQIQYQAKDSLVKARDVASATKEQAVTANGIASHVESIASMTEETNAATQTNADAAEQLKLLAAKLQQAVAYFKV